MRTSIIAGTAAAGLVLFIMALASVFFLRKRTRRRQRYWSLSRPKRVPSRSTFLVGEEMDPPMPSPPLDQPNPFSSLSLHRDSSAVGSISGAGSVSGAPPVYPHPRFSRSQSDSSSHAHHTFLPAPLLPPPPSSPFTPPRLLRARASESGSIFQESVWPPPSGLMDPLTHPSQSVNLARIVTDVMGPPEDDPLLLLPPGPSSQEQGQGLEQEHGVPEPDGEGEQRGMMHPDELSPQSDLRSPSPPSSPPEPLLPPEPESELPHPPSPPPWLTRSLNPSPRSSPLSLQRTDPT